MNTKILEQLNQATQKHRAKLVAVSKTKPVSSLLTLYEEGQRAFGENYVQELVDKQPMMPADTEWHFLGHLQTNKVKYIAGFVNFVHSVDSEKLMAELDKQAAKHDRKIQVLLQLHVAAEDTKSGFSPQEFEEFTTSQPWKRFPHIQVRGIMGMASFTDDTAQVRSEFKKLKQIFDQTKTQYFAEDTAFDTLSMGMSGDYELALEEGSTLIRVGSLLFGAR